MNLKLDSLPNEAKLLIVQYLSVREYLNLAESSRYWLNFLTTNVKYLQKWMVEQFSVKESSDGFECEAIIRGGKPTKIKVHLLVFSSNAK